MDKDKIEKSQFKIPIDPGVSKVKKKKNQPTTANNSNLARKKTIVKKSVDKGKVDKKDISQDNGKTEPVVKKANKKIGISSKTNNKNKNKKSNYRKTYQKTKAKLRLLIEEQEVLKDNLTRKDDQLVEISRDIHFILDRLLLYQDKLFNTNSATRVEESYKDLLSKNKLLKDEAVSKTSINKPQQNAKDRQDKSNKVSKSNVSNFDTLTNNTDKPSTSNKKNKGDRLNKTKPSSISKVKTKSKQPKTSTSLPVTKVRKKSGKKMNENQVSPSPSKSSSRKSAILPNPSLPKSMNAIKCNVSLPISRPSSPSRITLGSGFYQMSNSLEDGEEESPLKSKKHFSFDNLQDNENEFCNGSLNNFMSSSLRESQIENELDPHGSFESSETSSEPFVTCSSSLDSTVKSQLSYCIPTDIDQDMIPVKPPDTLPDDIFSET